MLPHKKRLKGKKGINDISILTIIFFIFFGTAALIPFLNAEFETGSSTYDTDTIRTNAQQNADSVETLNAFTVLKSVLQLAFFDFGDNLGLPIWLDILYTVLAIVFILTIARNIWIGGGG